ncbi:hypothetical protein [Amycolatopsis sp. Hca4]|uniref:hypothetical protein n=1 Tax=Amycolatopsis sp. Hca4 TaxID=2742131 RepID=UPI0015907657|nr:hypothetical protein [Amycolatopsis sp. Hca4]QKV75296.1 hypothetical protein HUT10_17100 [Amycolatopsis sp. Hca4]
MVDATDVEEGPELGRGGQGRVTTLRKLMGRPADGVVVKRYNPQVVPNAAALTRLVSWRRSLDVQQRQQLDAVACWPLSVLVERGRAVGTVLPLVPAGFGFWTGTPSGIRRFVLNELQFLVAGRHLLRRRGIPETTTADRLRILATFTEAVALLHGHDVVLGDLSLKNLLWRTGDEGPGIFLLDCDGLRLEGTDPVTPQSNSPSWADPAFPATQNQQSDAYKVALVVLRTLARDFHTHDAGTAGPTAGPELTSLLRSSLRRNPEARPSVSAWTGPLRSRAEAFDQIRKEGAFPA